MARLGFGGLGMRLDGSLEDFGLPDVLQLLSQTRKSGALHLAASDEERKGVIRLGEGAIDAACSDLRRQVLARRLVGAGLVSDDALSGAADDVRGGAPSLLRALLDRSGPACTTRSPNWPPTRRRTRCASCCAGTPERSASWSARTTRTG